MASVTVQLELERETKNTGRFKELAEVGTYPVLYGANVYLQKEAFPEGLPKHVSVTLEWEGA
ncbi:MAG: hypothetical protein Q8R28_15185 [Dehalococcoidia bacterium]|nr:hypothetical protein [Dehalococcoidia bacterium]